MINEVDIAWNEEWTGTSQTRFLSLDGIGSLSAHYEQASSTRIAWRKQSEVTRQSPVALFSGGCSCRRRPSLDSNRNDGKCPSPNVLAAGIALVPVACNRHLLHYF